MVAQASYLLLHLTAKKEITRSIHLPMEGTGNLARDVTRGYLKSISLAVAEPISVLSARNKMPDKEPRRPFSIVIPTLNEEGFLPRLLADLSRQDYRGFEVIVVDAKSKDKTLFNAREFQKKLPSLIILQSSRANVSLQRNMGAKKAKGKWIIFMDADDRIPPFFLTGVRYRTTKDKPDIFTCWCKTAEKSPENKAIETFLNLSLETLKLIDYPAALGALIGVKSRIFGKIGGFNVRTKFAEDSEFIRTAFKKGFKFSVFRDPYYIYSLRRLRKEGKMKRLRNYVRLNLKKLIKLKIKQSKDYPMGGSNYDY